MSLAALLLLVLAVLVVWRGGGSVSVALRNASALAGLTGAAGADVPFPTRDVSSGLFDRAEGPPALYVREARRLVSDYVLTELDCTGDRTAPDPVTLGSYAMDSHVVNYVVDAEGRLRADGWVSKSSKPYGISFRTLLPRRTEVSNLLVSVCVSSSHVAYGSLRMEPVFMNLGQAAATAAVLALDRGVTLHDLPYPALRSRLEADGQIFDAIAAKRALETARRALQPNASTP